MALGIEDKFAIQEVIARYALAYSNNEAETFSSLFAEDGLLEIGWSNVISSRLQGRKAIRDWAADVFKLMPVTRYARLWTSHPVVEGERDKAVATCFYNNLAATGDSLGTGVFRALLRHSKSGWLITQLTAMTDGSREESAAKEAMAVARTRRGAPIA